jgi:hypothetical protein
VPSRGAGRGASLRAAAAAWADRDAGRSGGHRDPQGVDRDCRLAEDHDFLWAADEPAGRAAGLLVRRGALVPGWLGEPLQARSVLPPLGGQRRVGWAEPGARRFAPAGPQDARAAALKVLRDELAGRALVRRLPSMRELPDAELVRW